MLPLPHNQHEHYHRATSSAATSSAATSPAATSPRRKHFDDFECITHTGKRLERPDDQFGSRVITVAENGSTNKTDNWKMETHDRKLRTKQKRSSSKTISTQREFTDLCSPTLVGSAGGQGVVLTPEPHKDEPPKLKSLSSWKSLENDLDEEVKSSHISRHRSRPQNRNLTTWRSCSALQLRHNDDVDKIDQESRRRHSKDWSPSPDRRKSVSFELPQVREIMRYPPEEVSKSDKDFRKSKSSGSSNNSLKKALSKTLSKKKLSPKGLTPEDPKLAEESRSLRVSPLPFLRRKISGPGSPPKRRLSETPSNSSLNFLRKKKFDFDGDSSVKSGGSHLSEHLGKLTNLKVNLQMRRGHKINEPMLTGFTRDGSEFLHTTSSPGEADSQSVTSFTSIESSASTANKIRHSRFSKKRYYEFPDSPSQDLRIRSSVKSKSEGPMKAFKNMLGKHSKSHMDLTVLERANSSGLSRSYDDILKENNFPTQEEFLVDSRMLTLSRDDISPGDFDDDADYYPDSLRRRCNFTADDDSTSMTGKTPTSKDSSSSQFTKSEASGEQTKEYKAEKDEIESVRNNATHDKAEGEDDPDIDSSSPLIHRPKTRRGSVHDIILKYEAMEQIKNEPSSPTEVPGTKPLLPHKPKTLIKSNSSESTFKSTLKTTRSLVKGHYSAEDSPPIDTPPNDLTCEENLDWKASLPWARDCKSKIKKKVEPPQATPRSSLANSSEKTNRNDSNWKKLGREREGHTVKTNLSESSAQNTEAKHHVTESEKLQKLEDKTATKSTEDARKDILSGEGRLNLTKKPKPRKDSLQQHQEHDDPGSETDKIDHSLKNKLKRTVKNIGHTEEESLKEYKGKSTWEQKKSEKRQNLQKHEGKTLVATKRQTGDWGEYKDTINSLPKDVENCKLRPPIPHVIVTEEPDDKIEEAEVMPVTSVLDIHENAARKASGSSTPEIIKFKKSSVSRKKSKEEAVGHVTVQQTLSASSTEDTGFFSSLHRLVMKNPSVSSTEDQPSLKERIVRKISSVSSSEEREITDVTLGKVPRKPSKKKTPPKRPPPPKLVFDKFNTYSHYLTADTTPVPQTPPPPKPPRLFQILSGYRKPTNMDIPTEAYDYRRYSLVDSDLDMIRSVHFSEEHDSVHEESASDDATDDDGETYSKFPLGDNTDDESLSEYPHSPEPDDTLSLSGIETLPDTPPPPLPTDQPPDTKDDNPRVADISPVSPPHGGGSLTKAGTTQGSHESLDIGHPPSNEDDNTFEDDDVADGNGNEEKNAPFPIFGSGQADTMASPLSEYDNVGSGQSSWSFGTDDQYVEDIAEEVNITSNKQQDKRNSVEFSDEGIVSDIQKKTENTDAKTKSVQFKETATITLKTPGDTSSVVRSRHIHSEMMTSDTKTGNNDSEHERPMYNKVSTKTKKDLGENATSSCHIEIHNRKMTIVDTITREEETEIRGTKLRETVAGTCESSCKRTVFNRQKKTQELEVTNDDSIIQDSEHQLSNVQSKETSQSITSSQHTESTGDDTVGDLINTEKEVEVVLNTREQLFGDEVSNVSKKSQTVNMTIMSTETNITEISHEDRINSQNFNSVNKSDEAIASSSYTDTTHTPRESPEDNKPPSVLKPMPVPTPRVSRDPRPQPTPRQSKSSSAPTSRPSSALSTASERPLLAMFFEKLLENHTTGETRRLSQSVDELAPEVSLTPQDEDKLSRSESHLLQRVNSEDGYVKYKEFGDGGEKDGRMKTSLDSSTFSDSPSMCDSYKSEMIPCTRPVVSPPASRLCVSENELVRGSTCNGALPPLSTNTCTRARPHPRPRPRPSLIRSNAVVESSDEDVQEGCDTTLSVVVSQGSSRHSTASAGVWVRRASDSLISQKDLTHAKKISLGQLTDAGYSGDTEEDEYEVGVGGGS
ncbi:hypothetical protein Hamer_G014211 [Homarus americanus]|uniref:Uncharacterized protein n=1 Tax=Homarus americanus TaxID=6706 RepID=A0A8J5JPJ0_HOMAM|nr:hypothetical protein Hamer_G014211 [Homarus americanus]